MSIIIGGGITIGGGINIDTTGGGAGGGATVTWSSFANFSSSASQSSIAYNGTNYVTMGSSYYNYSTDLSTWTGATQISGTPANTYLDNMVYGNGVFVAAGIQGNYVYTSSSSSGTGSWSTPAAANANPLGASNAGKGIVFGNGKFIIAGNDPSLPGHPGYYISSTNGSTWSALSQFNGYTGYFTPVNIIYNGSQFVVVGNTDTGGPRYATSSDGSTWTTPASTGTFGLTTPNIMDIVYGNGTYVALVSDYDPSTYALRYWTSTSTNLSSWTTAVSLGTLQLYSGRIAYGNGKFVTVGHVKPGSYQLPAWSASTDGATWSTPAQFSGVGSNWNDTNNNIMTSVTYVNSKFVALGRELGGSFRSLIGVGT
jgi:hypothetical protein